MNETVMELIGIVREVAPELWAMAMARVRANIAAEVFVCVMMAGVSFAFARVLNERKRRRGAGEWVDGDVDIVVGFALVCCVLIGFFVGIEAIQTALAPEYAALSLLAGMVK